MTAERHLCTFVLQWIIRVLLCYVLYTVADSFGEPRALSYKELSDSGVITFSTIFKLFGETIIVMYREIDNKKFIPCHE
ncbi:MAG: hypothetical protein DI610_11380 [Staphylococcus hominis]|nr:MAG: hypothetical protein DI610_11380 [Staphylococcus hominis]